MHGLGGTRARNGETVPGNGPLSPALSAPTFRPLRHRERSSARPRPTPGRKPLFYLHLLLDALKPAVVLIGIVLALVIGGAAAAEPAKFAFGATDEPSTGSAAAHGRYSAGCLAGAVQLPESGPDWQAMRLSRNRYWGHPDTIAFIKRLAQEGRSVGWGGLYVGDISQPRGGPMLSGHRSHQVGLDVDIWLRPGRRLNLSTAEREEIGSPPVVSADRLHVNEHWTSAHAEILETAASDPAVARIFVNAAIKRQLCDTREPGDTNWLRKVRPWWGHDSHFHVRLRCPPGDACIEQQPPPAGDGCDATLAWWFTDEALNPPPPAPGEVPPELTLADLPEACQAVIGNE